jgi:phosphoglycerate dehydrogenase-like enzyme
LKEKLENIIEEYVDNYEQKPDIKSSWRSPLTAYADSNDQLFKKLKEIVSENHALPEDLLTDARTVISFFLPFDKSINKSNIDGQLSSRDWAIAYIETNRLIYELNKEIKDADVLVAMLMRQFDTNLIKKGNNLKWIQSWSAGVDKFLEDNNFKYLKENDISLTSVRGIHKDSMSEQVMGYLISFSRRLPEFMELQKQKEWERLKVDYLKNKTLSIFGLGAVGKEVAKKAQTFKMNVIGVKRNTDVEIPGVEAIYSPDQAEQVLNKSDYVVVTMPLTEETRGYFDYEKFKAMQETAYFINVARGEIVKEEEMIKALNKDFIAGAALDVFEEEPLPKNSPLYEMDNVIITPHTSGLFPNYNKGAVEIFKNNLRLFLEGKELMNVIDPIRQY